MVQTSEKSSPVLTTKLDAKAFFDAARNQFISWGHLVFANAPQNPAKTFKGDLVQKKTNKLNWLRIAKLPCGDMNEFASLQLSYNLFGASNNENDYNTY
jgi:hypothetical protein